MSTQPTVTKDTIAKMISLLDWCYRLGVEAAYDLQDEGLAREFVGRTSKPGVYGFLTEEPVYITWQEWTLRLMAKARSTSWSGSMNRYFNAMGRFGANYLSAFLPLTQVFLCKGVNDYYSAPSGADMAMFNSKTRVWWTPKGLRTIKNDEWVSELQMQSYDLERRDAEVWESNTAYEAKKVALTAKQYCMFRRCVGLVMMKGK